MADTEHIEQIAAGIRRRVFEHVLAHDGGYLSQALSAGEIFAALYGSVLRLAPVEGSLLPGAVRRSPRDRPERTIRTGRPFQRSAGSGSRPVPVLPGALRTRPVRSPSSRRAGSQRLALDEFNVGRLDHGDDRC